MTDDTRRTDQALTDLRVQLLIERFGPVRQVERERPPTPAEIAKRQRVLLEMP